MTGSSREEGSSHNVLLSFTSEQMRLMLKSVRLRGSVILRLFLRVGVRSSCFDGDESGDLVLQGEDWGEDDDADDDLFDDVILRRRDGEGRHAVSSMSSVSMETAVTSPTAPAVFDAAISP